MRIHTSKRPARRRQTAPRGHQALAGQREYCHGVLTRWLAAEAAEAAGEIVAVVRETEPLAALPESGIHRV
jgi:hypothetical protein